MTCRRSYVTLAVIACLAGGCKKDMPAENGEERSKRAETSDPAAGGAGEDLWALAPRGATIGIVAARGSVARALGAVETVRASYARMPGGADAVARFDAFFAQELPVAPRSDADLQSAGLDPEGAAALFRDGDGAYLAVLPVSEREAFVRAAGGTTEDRAGEVVDILGDATCAVTAGHYACSTSDALLDTLGEGASLGEKRDLSADADVEIVAAPASKTHVSASVRFEDGGVTARARVTMDTSAVMSALGEGDPALAARLRAADPPGFVRLHGLHIPRDALPDTPTPLGLSARQLAGALGGDLVVEAAGEDGIRVVLGLARRKIAVQAVPRLCAMIAQLPPVRAELKGDRCEGTLRIPPAAEELVGIAGTHRFAIEVGADALEASLTGAWATSPARQATPTPTGETLLDKTWTGAMWGFGQLSPTYTELAGSTARVAGGENAGRVMMWTWLHLVELGLGVRVDNEGAEVLVRVGTSWGDPDGVVAALDEAFARAVDGADVSAELATLAKRHPDSTFARAHSNGTVAMLPVIAGFGVISAIAIPSFRKYVEKKNAARPAPPTR